MFHLLRSKRSRGALANCTPKARPRPRPTCRPRARPRHSSDQATSPSTRKPRSRRPSKRPSPAGVECFDISVGIEIPRHMIRLHRLPPRIVKPDLKVSLPRPPSTSLPKQHSEERGSSPSRASPDVRSISLAPWVCRSRNLQAEAAARQMDA